jgi:hypothetical protein
MCHKEHAEQRAVENNWLLRRLKLVRIKSRNVKLSHLKKELLSGQGLPPVALGGGGFKYS